MDINKIVQFRLLKSEFRKQNIPNPYRVVYLTKDNYTQYWDDINTVIKLLHADLEWDGIPTQPQVEKRFNNNSELFLWYYEDTIVGWTWFNESVTLDWENKFQSIDNGELYVGAAFISKKVNLPPQAGWKFYNLSFHTWLTTMKYNVIYLYSDDWNRASAMICYRCGFTKYNFIKEKNGTEYE